MKYDAVVVHSHMLNEDQTLSDQTRERMDEGIEIMQKDRANYLITTNGRVQETDRVEHAVAMQNYAITKGIDKSRILIEPTALDTVGQIIAQFSRFVQPNNWDKIAVVSSAYHIPRIKAVSETLYPDTVNVDYIGVPTEHPRSKEAEQSSLRIFKEQFAGVEKGNVEQMVERLFEKHPFYQAKPELKHFFYEPIRIQN